MDEPLLPRDVKTNRRKINSSTLNKMQAIVAYKHALYFPSLSLSFFRYFIIQ